jgi:Flp pilus assembly protein TadG
MRTRLRQLRDDERGMSLILVSIGFFAFFAATALAIDVGMFMNARSQAQNAADAGALAGAVALAVDDFDDHSPSGPAVQATLSAARANEVMRAQVAVEPGDVTFPVGKNGRYNRVRVNVYRTGARQNPVSTLIGPIFGVNVVDIDATATAEAAPANAMTCVRPFTIPDRWTENGNGPWTTSSTYDRYDKKGNVLPNADAYIKPGQPGYNGYNAEKDKGLPLTLRAGGESNISPTFYYSWKMPGAIGGSYYEDNIKSCNTTVMPFGAVMVQEPGSMMGPTASGIDDLLAQDPNAYWDTVSRSVKSPHGRSPRVFPIPLYDPEVYAAGTATGRNATLVAAGWIGFFVERRVGNEVYGRITPVRGVVDNNLGPAPEGTFPYAIRLVQ